RTRASSGASSSRRGPPVRSRGATTGSPTLTRRRMTGWPTAPDSYHDPMTAPARGQPVHLDPAGPEPVGLGRFGEFGGRVVAETGAGQHGVATATAAALFGLDCLVFMGAVDVERQALNVFRMKLLGADVVPVTGGSGTLKDAINEALRDWVATVQGTHYCIGSVVGPHPYPWMVREFQRVVGDEAREQCREILGGADPDLVVACVGGGSNAMGTFAGFVDTGAELIGVEAGGLGIE